MGVFIGDEIVCMGTPLGNFTAVADLLRAELGPAAWIYTNECSQMEQWPPIDPSTGTGGIPVSLSAISVDFYDNNNTDGAAEVAKNKRFYSNVLFPKVRVKVPPGPPPWPLACVWAGRSPAHCPVCHSAAAPRVRSCVAAAPLTSAAWAWAARLGTGAHGLAAPPSASTVRARDFRVIARGLRVAKHLVPRGQTGRADRDQT